MGALPKRKYAKARQGGRRSHLHLQPQALVACPQCRTPRLAHHVCPVCGTYKSKEVLATSKPKRREQ